VETAVGTDREARIGDPMKSELNHAKGKKQYESPTLTTISLRPEEAVLGHCKTSGTGGPVQSTCTLIGPCSSVGS
jgi:hypothetical protein